MNLQNKDLVIILGAGPDLEKTCDEIGHDIRIVVIDAISYVLWSLDNVRSVTGEVSAIIKALGPHMMTIATGRAEIIQDREAVEKNKQFYIDLLAALRRELNAVLQSIKTVAWRSTDMHGNVWRNFDTIIKSPGVIELFGCMEKKPCIIAAGGPSLTKQMEFIRQHRARVCLLCVDTALKPLQASGITPDIMVAVDYLQLNYEKAKGADRAGYYVAAMPQVVKDFYDYFAGQLFVIYNHGVLSDWLSNIAGDRGHLESGGSVAHTAFQLALKMGCDPIIFVGLDLAFVGRVSHADGSIYHKREISDQEWSGTVPVPSVDGGTVRTSHDMWSFIVMFEKMIENMKEARSIINTTDGGAVVKGMAHMPVEDAAQVLDGMPVLDAYDIIDGYHARSEHDPSEFYAAEERVRLRKLIEHIGRLSATAARSCDWLIKNGSSKSTVAQKHLKRLHRASAALIENRTVAAILDDFLIGLNYDHHARRGCIADGKSGTPEDVKELKLFSERIADACGKYVKLMEG